MTDPFAGRTAQCPRGDGNITPDDEILLHDLDERVGDGASAVIGDGERPHMDALGAYHQIHGRIVHDEGRSGPGTRAAIADGQIAGIDGDPNSADGDVPDRAVETDTGMRVDGATAGVAVDRHSLCPCNTQDGHVDCVGEIQMGVRRGDEPSARGARNIVRMGDRAGGATHHDCPVVGVHTGHGIGQGCAAAAIESIGPVGQRTDRHGPGTFACARGYARQGQGDRVPGPLVACTRDDIDMSADGHAAVVSNQLQIGDGLGIAIPAGARAVLRPGADRYVAKDDQIVLHDIDERVGGGAAAAKAAGHGFDIETMRADSQMHIGIGLDEAGQRRHAGAAGVEGRDGDPRRPRD